MQMKQELEYQIAAICQELSGTEIQVDLTRPEEQHGDYATNVALQLAGKLGKNPREIAEELAVKLRENLGGEVSDVSVAGPGFLNLKLSDQSLIKALDLKPTRSLEGKTIVAEYSDPNPFKVLHAGHLYTTLVGDSISRLLQTAGANVHRLNYGGDVGLHVGKTMWAIIQELGGEHPEKLAEVPEESRLDWLSTRYVEGNNAYQDDEIAKAGIIAYNKQVYELHTNKDHDSPFAQIYWMGREWSYQGFTKLYQQLQVESFEKFIPESEVTPVGLDIVKRGLEEGVFKQSDGAVVFEGEPHGLHTRVFINSNGLPTYEAKDLGLAATKWEQYHFDLGIIITANDIVEYMKVVLKALDHFYPEIVERSKHLTHGIIKLPGGVKMSSRLGNILRADDILDQTREALQAAGREVKYETMLAAVKYAFIKNRMGGDIIYDPAESVSLEGNSGPYLQYAHARAQSILAKAGNVPGLADETALQPDERSLARKISEFTEIVDKAVNDLMPHHIATYLYELAQAFNRFYENNRVIGDERQEARLALVSIYAKTLKDGLSLLGITAPDRM
jgi:arginyl-tRNA synthetase